MQPVQLLTFAAISISCIIVKGDWAGAIAAGGGVECRWRQVGACSTATHSSNSALVRGARIDICSTKGVGQLLVAGVSTSNTGVRLSKCACTSRGWAHTEPWLMMPTTAPA